MLEDFITLFIDFMQQKEEKDEMFEEENQKNNLKVFLFPLHAGMPLYI